MGSKNFVRPPALGAGSRVALLAPAGPLLEHDDLLRGEELCRALGFEPVLGSNAYRHYGYLASASGKTRLRIRALLGRIGEPAPRLPQSVPFTCDCCGGLLTFLREIAPIRPMRAPPPLRS